MYVLQAIECSDFLVNLTSSLYSSSYSNIKMSSICLLKSKYNCLFGSVSFGDMYAEERKDVLVRVKIPGHKADVDKEALISVNLSYCNVKEAKMTKELTIVSVKRSKEVPAGLTPSPEVIDQRCRFAGIEAMQLATQV